MTSTTPRETSLRQSLLQVARFAAAGVINTLLGLAVILALDIGLGVPPAIANAVGYAVGIAVSWVLQSRFVFRADASGWATKLRYITVIAVSFGVNQLVLWAMHSLLGDSQIEHAAAQVTAMGTYTVLQFVLFKLWVFNRPAA